MVDVVALWRYPLKSARGERLDAVGLTASGIDGDRRWACVDAVDGTVGSAKHPARWGLLRAVRARLDDDTLTVEVEGRHAEAGTAEADRLVSDHLGRAVRLTHERPDGARLHRRVPDDPDLVPEWMGVEADAELVTDLAAALPDRRFVDLAPVHLLTTGALEELAGQLGSREVAPERFRANLLLDLPRDPQPGEELRVGDTVLRVMIPTPRCAVPGLADDLTVDRELMHVLARHHRQPVAQLGRAACFGAYAEVVRPGRVTAQAARRSWSSAG